ncbi:MAG: deoxynucleoside kinase [Clostridia bacterium]|nr:deoxynucleoside kinase [Clostridia bacterium]
MKSKLIVIEGVDSSGKATQSRLLYQKLVEMGYSAAAIEFPNYNSDSSAVVKMYLNGEFGKEPESVSAYAASVIFAVDRFATVKNTYKQMFEQSDVVIADRYTTSNMVHQASKIADVEQKGIFLDWLYDLEYNKLSLPQPDLTIFLDMPVEHAKVLMAQRANKIDNTMQKDIHESNDKYLQESYDNACFVAKKYNWTQIKCVKDEKVRNIEDIASEILDSVLKIL